MSYTLYGFEGNPRTRIAQVVAKYAGADLKISEVKRSTGSGLEAYKEKFPLVQGKIPTLEGSDGLVLHEVIAISFYLANGSKILPSSKAENSEVLQWASWVNSELAIQGAQWVVPLLPDSHIAYNKANVSAAEAKFLAYVDVLEKILHTRTFLVGHRISVADIFLAGQLIRPFATVLDPSFRSSHPNLLRYFNTVVNQPEFASVLGGKGVTLADKKIAYTPPKKEAKAPAAPAAAAAGAAAPKAAKKAAKKDDDDDDEPSVPAEPKAKHPCEALGPAKSFPFDEWKRTYSNMDFPKAMEWLSSKLDESEYSFWRVTYKYNEELTQVFMSANLIGGFHSRLEGSRKYLFGSAGVYGKANASKIQGAYMIRGQDYKGVFDVAPDWESYDFEKLDFNKDAEFIKGCWNWDNTFDGLEYADGKVFK